MQLLQRCKGRHQLYRSKLIHCVVGLHRFVTFQSTTSVPLRADGVACEANTHMPCQALQIFAILGILPERLVGSARKLQRVSIGARACYLTHCCKRIIPKHFWSPFASYPFKPHDHKLISSWQRKARAPTEPRIFLVRVITVGDPCDHAVSNEHDALPERTCRSISRILF